MPKVQWDNVEDTQTFAPLPEGAYVVEVAEVYPDKTTKNGDEMWRIEFEILEGQYRGRKLFDNMVFSQKAMPRVKYVCSKLGIETKGTKELTPADIYRRKCLLTTTVEDRIDEQTGIVRKQNRIPWNGYAEWQSAPPNAASPGIAPDESKEEEVPF